MAGNFERFDPQTECYRVRCFLHKIMSSLPALKSERLNILCDVSDGWAFTIVSNFVSQRWLRQLKIGGFW